MAVAATAFVTLVGGCSDITLVSPTVPLEELLVLPLQAGAPAVGTQSFYAVNSRTVRRQLTHDDPTFTVYLDLTLPAGSLARLNGAELFPTDSVLVTVQPRTGSYGMTLSPNGLEFAADARPTVTFDYGRYGDLSVADGSPTYSSRASYAAALTLWFEEIPGRWRRVAGSGPSGTDRVSGPVATPGRYVVAAPR